MNSYPRLHRFIAHASAILIIFTALCMTAHMATGDAS